jgi:uncharacterized protein (DUF697 family)
MKNRSVVTTLMCVAAVAGIVFAAGRLIFPFVEPTMGEFPFSVAEAVLSATIGFALDAAMFG